MPQSLFASAFVATGLAVTLAGLVSGEFAQSAQDGDAMRIAGDDADMMSAEAADEGVALTQQELDFFETSIRPVLVEHCYECHSRQADRIRGGLRVDTRDALRLGAPGDAAIVPGDPDASLLIQAIRYEHFDLEMPPRGKLDDQIIADFERWVEMGAPDPRVEETHAGEDAEPLWTREIDYEEARQFWAFVPPALTPPGDIKHVNWPRTEIDRYVLAKMEEHNLTPVRDADGDALIRRLSFDLTGLPPTPEQVATFARDNSPDAVANLVDRLLASEQFGERWGRHWLDVARYAESSGKESNIVYPHAWRYRDYVIDSFNADKPYDEFIVEQIAGDLLPAGTDNERAEHLIATGYLAVGTKGHNTRGRPQFAFDLVDEQIDAMSQGMLGMTISCARCHDHKFDPIPTTDYYAFAGIFLSTETRFGTVVTGGNRHASELIELPDNAEIPAGSVLPTIIRTALERRYEQVTSQRDRLIEQQRASRQRDRDAAIRLRQLGYQVNVFEELLGRFDGSGRPVGAYAMGVHEADRATDARVLIRGEIDKPGDVAPRGFLTVLERADDPIINKGSGRLELAEWIASERNPLTARVWVNRIWLHLLGTPLVPTPDNFGASGMVPSHPELLDYLAIRFMESGWSTKSLIREIVLSRVYQLGAHHNSQNHRIDPDNTYMWRMASRRLEGEAIRDAMLSVSGLLDLERPVGSPVSWAEGGVQGLQQVPQQMMEPPVRSVYLPLIRDDVPESLAVFDFAEPSFVTGDRNETTVPSQALYLLNDETVIRYAEAFAARVLSADLNDGDRIGYAFKLAFGREPTRSEEAAARAFFMQFAQAQPAPEPQTRPGNNLRDRLQQRTRRQLAWAAFCQSLFASAEFRYLN